MQFFVAAGTEKLKKSFEPIIYVIISYLFQQLNMTTLTTIWHYPENPLILNT